MADVTFYPVHVGDDKESSWKASNRALGKLLARHRNDLCAAQSVAEAIRSHLVSLFGLLDDLCRNSCPWCPDPCCILNKVWFDFRDLLFLHLLELPIPPAQLNCGNDQACRYLGHRGCRIPRSIRPWACTQYVCATQRNYLARLEDTSISAFQIKLDEIHALRMEMEQSVCRVCTSSRRA